MLLDRSGSVLDELTIQSNKDAEQNVDISKDHPESSKCALLPKLSLLSHKLVLQQAILRWLQ